MFFLIKVGSCLIDLPTFVINLDKSELNGAMLSE